MWGIVCPAMASLGLSSQPLGEVRAMREAGQDKVTRGTTICLVQLDPVYVFASRL